MSLRSRIVSGHGHIINDTTISMITEPLHLLMKAMRWGWKLWKNKSQKIKTVRLLTGCRGVSVSLRISYRARMNFLTWVFDLTLNLSAWWLRSHLYESSGFKGRTGGKGCGKIDEEQQKAWRVDSAQVISSFHHLTLMCSGGIQCLKKKWD